MRLARADAGTVKGDHVVLVYTDRVVVVLFSHLQVLWVSDGNCFFVPSPGG